MAHAIASEEIKLGVSTYLSYRVLPGVEAVAIEEQRWTEQVGR